MTRPPTDSDIPLVQPVGEVVIGELWRELKRLASEEALSRQIRHDGIVARVHYPKLRRWKRIK